MPTTKAVPSIGGQPLLHSAKTAKPWFEILRSAILAPLKGGRELKVSKLRLRREETRSTRGRFLRRKRTPYPRWRTWWRKPPQSQEGDCTLCVAASRLPHRRETGGQKGDGWTSAHLEGSGFGILQHWQTILKQDLPCWVSLSLQVYFTAISFQGGLPGGNEINLNRKKKSVQRDD